MNGFIVPQIGYEHFTNIKVNFGSSNFKFRLKKLIDKYNNVISTKNNFIHQKYNINKFEYTIKYQSKISKLIQPPKIIIKNKGKIKLFKNAKEKYIKLLKINDKYEPSVNINSSDEDNHKSINIIGKKIPLSPINNNTENISNWAQHQENEPYNDTNTSVSSLNIPSDNNSTILNNSFYDNPFFNFQITPPVTSFGQNILSYTNNQIYNNDLNLLENTSYSIHQEPIEYIESSQSSSYMSHPPPPYSTDDIHYDLESQPNTFTTTDIVNNIFEAVTNQLNEELNNSDSEYETDSVEQISDD